MPLLAGTFEVAVGSCKYTTDSSEVHVPDFKLCFCSFEINSCAQIEVLKRDYYFMAIHYRY